MYRIHAQMSKEFSAVIKNEKMKAKLLCGGSEGGVEKHGKLLPEIMKGVLKRLMKVLDNN